LGEEKKTKPILKEKEKAKKMLVYLQEPRNPHGKKKKGLQRKKRTIKKTTPAGERRGRIPGVGGNSKAKKRRERVELGHKCRPAKKKRGGNTEKGRSAEGKGNYSSLRRRDGTKQVQKESKKCTGQKQATQSTRGC